MFIQGSRMSLVCNDLEYVAVVPSGFVGLPQLWYRPQDRLDRPHFTLC
jgi:hypothetical protein